MVLLQLLVGFSFTFALSFVALAFSFAFSFSLRPLFSFVVRRVSRPVLVLEEVL